MLTISPDNKLTIAIVPFYCQAYGVREISDIPHIKAYQYIFCYHLVLSFRRIPMRNDRLCHSNDCKEEDSPLLRAQEKSLHSHCHQHFSFRCFPFKYPYGLWQAIRTVVPPTEMIVPNLWNGCAKRLAQLCHCDGTVVPKAWHKHAKGVAQAKHTFYSSSAMLSLPSKHTYKGTLYQIVKLE